MEDHTFQHGSILPKIEESTFDSAKNVFVIDAPGISSSSPASRKRLEKHLKNGGRIFHKARIAEDGAIIFTEPQYMWPMDQTQ